MNRRDLLKYGAAAAASAATLGGLGTPAGAQQTAIFKASDVHPPGYPTVVAVESMGKKLSAATNGRLSVQMYPSMQLGDEKTAIEQCQLGAIALGRVSVGTLGVVADDLNVFNLPFVFRDPEHMERVVDGPVGQRLLGEVSNNPDTHLVALCFMDAGSRGMYNTKHPIDSIADMKGLKIRVNTNPLFVDMMNDLGANGVPMGYDQVISAMQTGVVDGAENNLPSYVFDGHYQIAKYYTFTDHLVVPEILIFSGPVWAKLSPADQALVRRLAHEASLEERDLWHAKEKDALAKMTAAGITPVHLDKKPFQAAVKPVWDKYGAKYADLIKQIAAVK
jgi:tripartite ATP-independent transporter DctP family solute receptor